MKEGLAKLKAQGINSVNDHYVLKNEKIGGPKDLASLFSVEEIKADFPNYDFEELEEKEIEIELSEGHFYNGKGSVIRFVGRKK